MNDSKEHDDGRQRPTKAELLRKALARQAQFVMDRLKRGSGPSDEEPKK